jgi:hypothetical protein
VQRNEAALPLRGHKEMRVGALPRFAGKKDWDFNFVCLPSEKKYFQKT